MAEFTSVAITLDYGNNIETLMFEGLQNINKTDAHASSTVGYHLLMERMVPLWIAHSMTSVGPVLWVTSIMMATHISLIY